ncbi:RHS repeat-associated core domain-containing protein [Candidatus Thiosymbion oneisti]|uniref:RHS repeat-associated core domain-containing protein n=1 Tax=Candidatus Thiosymbion oneisti TaxID=589554 RepID=UPI000AD0D14D|nr:RHS repeat-associated core domain-containing protein [Candidatus Thiosymbion oneisti]
MSSVRDLFGILAVLALFLAVSPVAAYDTPPWDTGHQGFNPEEGDGEKDNPTPDDNQCPLGNPVNAATGDNIELYTDFDIPGPGPKLGLTRTYHCQDRIDGPFGRGWHSNLTATAIAVTDGEQTYAIVRQGDGKRKRFTRNPDGTFEAAAGTYQTLDLNSDGSITLTGRYGDVEKFDVNGRIIERRDRYGNTLHFTYDGTGFLTSVTDDAGRTLSFAKGANGKVASVTDPLGRTYSYSYDENGDLVAVTDPIGGVMAYGYNADGDLLTVVDPRGNTVVTNTYDNEDRVTRQVFADGATIRFNYVSDTDTETRVTDERGNITVYKFNETGNPIEITDPLGRVTRSTWDDNYNRLSRTDGNGHTTAFTYDANGNLLTETDALSQVTTYTYESTYSQVTSETDAEGNVTRFEYDSRGNLIKIIDAQSNRAVLTYDTQGRLTSATDPRGNTTSYSFDAAGNLTRVTDALGNTATMTFDAVGNLLSVTDAEGRTTRFEYDGLNRRIKILDALGGETKFTYDANGNLTSTTDPRGHAITYAYDSRNRQTGMTNALAQTETRGYDRNGNLTSVTDVAGNTQTYGYDAADQLTTETLPGSATYQYEYDKAGNRTADLDPTGVRIERTYDVVNRQTGIIDSNGDQQTYTYDKLGNRTGTERKDSTNQIFYRETLVYDELSQAIQIVAGMGQTTHLDYDSNGNLTTVTDPLGQTTSRAYDALDRIAQLTDAATGITHYAYDRVGNLTGVTDPRGLITGYGYDNLDRQDRLDSPDTGITGTEYDANGNLTKRTDSRGITVTHGYDKLNRRIGTSFPTAGEDRSYFYDQGTNGTGRLTSYDDQSGQTRFVYDARGNRVSETRTIQSWTYSLGYGYDSADRLTSLTYPSGLTVVYGYDGQGRIQIITADGLPVLSDIAYLPFGPATTWSDGSGLDHAEAFDTDYRATSITVGGIQDFGYGYDAADNITDWTDALNAANTQSFVYDALDRLIDADGPYGAIDFSYDAVGNRLLETIGAGVTNYRYATDSNRLQETTGTDPGSYSYDAAGNLIQDDRFTYIYNQANRLAEVKQGTATIATYLYNAEGQRVVKTVGGRTSHFLYGPGGQLLGVYDAATGDAREEILYFDSIPVATARNGTLYYIHTDHLGTPRLVSDQNQTLVWRWISDPFGKATPNQDPDGNGTSFVLNLRFPGQYFDAETERHYNYFRDYDPAIGRYVQSDPIGLGGGLNTYAYVGGNPLFWIDPFGLEVTRHERPVNLDGIASILNYTGAKHHWIKTDMLEAGMGPQGGNVPGQGDNKDLPGVPVETIDHSGQSIEPNARQIPIPYPVDEQCVNNLIRPGRDLGRFIPFFNDCKGFVDDVLDECRIDDSQHQNVRK